MFNWNTQKFRVAELEDQIEQLKHDQELAENQYDRTIERNQQSHRHEMNRLQQKLDEINDIHVDKVNRLQEAHDRELNAQDAEFTAVIRKLEGQVEGLTSLERDHQTVVSDAAQLDEERKNFRAERDAFGSIKAAVQRAQDRGEATAEARYKEGYADGLSDGLRKGIDVTKDDRQAMLDMANKVVDQYEPPAVPTVPTPQILVVDGAKGTKPANEQKKN